jgi:hypothetical protein
MQFYFLSNSDFEFSAQLVKICDQELDQLIFVDNIESLEIIKFNKSSLLIIDCDDFCSDLVNIIDKVNQKKIHICGVTKKINKKLYKQAILDGFDIFLTKSNFLFNVKTIKIQLLNSLKRINN